MTSIPLILYCDICDRVLYEGAHGNAAANVRDFHEHDRDHDVHEFIEIDGKVVRIAQTVVL
jgi:hypothetical protein